MRLGVNILPVTLYCIMSCQTNLIIQWYCTQDLNDIFHERNTQRILSLPLRWRHIGRDSVSNHQPHDCLLNRLFRRRSKKTSKLRVTRLFVGNSQGTSEFPAQMASNAEYVSIWWRHHVKEICYDVEIYLMTWCAWYSMTWHSITSHDLHIGRGGERNWIMILGSNDGSIILT